MSGDPRVLFAAERTLFAWQRSSLSLMGFGFLIERFGLFLRALHPSVVVRGQHLFALVIGIIFILIGVACAFLSSEGYRRCIRSQRGAGPQSFSSTLSFAVNYGIAAIGLVLAIYLIVSSGSAS